MTLAQLDYRRAMLFVALAAVVAMAFLTRMDFLILKGGLAADQVAWASQHYLGVITNAYLVMRDAILSWTREALPWPYLPGYPAFLAVLAEAGVRNLALVRFVQVALDSLAILPLYFVLHRIGHSAVFALTGCLIYAVAPWWGTGSTYLLAESMLPALTIALLGAMVFVQDRAGAGLRYWFVLGLLASISPFFRSEMVLLFGPLAIWALLVAPKRRRLISAACVVAGFALPLILWVVRNSHVHGQFMLTPTAKWYAAWSGLGQLENSFGYVVSDDHAAKLLASKGIAFNSPQSEAYWLGEYRAAWVNHPGYVIRTILHRCGQILGQPETQAFVPRYARMAYPAMAFMTAIALLWLLRMRRWADAFLIAWPMLYALGSLGPLYVELRYVRYAGLTYLLVLPVVLGKATDFAVAAWPRRYRWNEPWKPASVMSMIGLAVVAVGALLQLASTTRAARVEGQIERLDLGSAGLPASRKLDDIAFQPVIPAIQMSRDQAGLHLQAQAPAGIYLLMAPIGVQASAGVVIRYRVTLTQRAIGLGVLSGDSNRWLSYEPLSGAAGSEIEGTFASVVERGSHLVIDAQGADGDVRAVIGTLDWTFVCPRTVGLFDLLFNKATVEARACTAQGASG